MINTLEAVLDDIRGRLSGATRERGAAMHTAIVGTADGDLRVMVLRAADPALAELRLHTDMRCPKVAVIDAQPAVSLLAYDPAAKLQIRARGVGRIERRGPVADAAWAAASRYARRCYLAQAAPGTPVNAPTSGLPAEVEGIHPTDEQLLPARENFAVLLIELQQLDWLYLAHDGHRRAQFTRGGVDQSWVGSWVVP